MSITFERQFLKAGQMASHSRGPERVRVGAFERDKASRVGQILTRFPSLPKGAKSEWMAEAEQLDDILNANAGLLAGAQLFYARTQRRFSVELFREHAPALIEELMSYNVFAPITFTLPEGTDGVTHYSPALLRTVLRLGQARGIDGTTGLF